MRGEEEEGKSTGTAHVAPARVPQEEEEEGGGFFKANGSRYPGGRLMLWRRRKFYSRTPNLGARPRHPGVISEDHRTTTGRRVLGSKVGKI